MATAVSCAMVVSLIQASACSARRRPRRIGMADDRHGRERADADAGGPPGSRVRATVGRAPQSEVAPPHLVHSSQHEIAKLRDAGERYAFCLAEDAACSVTLPNGMTVEGECHASFMDPNTMMCRHRRH